MNDCCNTGMNPGWVRYVAYIIVAIPFVISVMWLLSVFAFGIGVVGPYLVFFDMGYGFGRTTIYGTLFILGMFLVLVSCIKICEKLDLQIDCLLGVALIELILYSAHDTEYLYTW